MPVHNDRRSWAVGELLRLHAVGSFDDNDRNVPTFMAGTPLNARLLANTP